MWYNVYQGDLVVSHETRDAARISLVTETTTTPVPITYFRKLVGIYHEETYRDLCAEREEIKKLALDTKGTDMEKYWWSMYSRFWWDNRTVKGI